jgi:hypothetical protein
VTIAILLAVGVASFLAMLVLGAYAPDLRGGGGNGGGHALSNAFHGYTGIVRLIEATGGAPRVIRNVHLLDTEDLVVATPENGVVPVGPVLDPREGKPTLIVLPKWTTMPDPDHRGWATLLGSDPTEAVRVLAPASMLPVIQRRGGGRPLRTVEATMKGVAFTAPPRLQAIGPFHPNGKSYYGELEPLVTDEVGNVVVGRFTKQPVFILSDPDLLDNRGIRDPQTAVSALAMLAWMNSNQAKGIAFDVTLNGLGHSASPLKLVFEPPFLAMTLTLAVAILLAGLASAARFGSPRRQVRAIAFGKTALLDNTAALVRKAGREAKLGGRYAEAIREVAARAFGAPGRLRGQALDAYLDRMRGGERFTTLAGAVARAETRDDLTRAARALHDWMGRRPT